MTRDGWHIRLTGPVQGGGWRPRIACWAQQHGLTGWVANTGAGLELVVAGPDAASIVPWLQHLLPTSKLQLMPIGVAADDFRIRDSVAGTGAWPPLDRALCAACRAEMSDPTSRRYADPFISCADCGPRYTVLAALPYDRAATAWAGLPMCGRCHAEYLQPDSRRYHVQGISCPQCGPELQWWTADGLQPIPALAAAVAALLAGQVVAVQGLGGFHLLAAARQPQAIAQLRALKRRPSKPLAVMFADLDALQQDACPSPLESQWLQHPAAPIVLVARRPNLPEALAPGSPWLGAMLAYTPLHLLLCQHVGQPLVVTSANRSGEPILWHPAAVREQWAADIAGWLQHNRPILRPSEDAVLRIAAGRLLWLRLGRGVAPLRLPLSGVAAGAVALGAHQKNAVAISDGSDGAWLAGAGADLDSIAGEAHADAQAQALAELLAIQPTQVVVDAHPGYANRNWWPHLPRRQVWHHPAHLAAVAEEAGIIGPLLGLAWDGTGLGEDGSSFGGEAYLHLDGRWQHLAGLWPLSMPGGDVAVREPWRLAWSLVVAAGGNPRQVPALADVPAASAKVVAGMLQSGFRVPQVSSLGRLFDGWSALLGLGGYAGHDAAAAMALEYAAQAGCCAGPDEWLPALSEPGLAWRLDQSAAVWRIDWRPAVAQLLPALCRQLPQAEVACWARRFHATWADVAYMLATQTGSRSVVLGGGCWQNRLLLEAVVRRLQAAGIAVYWPERFPPNDGGLAYGQLALLKSFEPVAQS